MKYNFAKLLQSGGKIPKYQNASGPLPNWYDILWKYKTLKGWDTSKDSSEAGVSIKNAYHGHAGDLNTAFQANLEYTSNPNLVGLDIQSVANSDKFTDINDFINKYNQNIDKLNNYFNTEIEYGDAAREHNQLFKTMYSSRSALDNTGINGNIGYQTGLENKAGSSTWLRRGDKYETEFEDLTDELKALRTHEVILNGNKYQVYKKANGYLGLLPASDISLTNTNNEESFDDLNDTNSNEITNSNENTDDVIEDSTYSLYPLPSERERNKWLLDPLSIIATTANNVAAAERDALWQKKQQYHLLEGEHFTAPRKNRYHLRTSMHQNANELIDRAAMTGLTSNIDEFKRKMSPVYDKALSIENEAELQKALGDEETRAMQAEAAQKTINSGVKTRNENMKIIDTNTANIIDANRRRNLAKTAAINAGIDLLTTSAVKYILDENINDAAYQRGLNDFEAALAKRGLLNNYYNFANDPTKSKAYKSFYNWITSKDSHYINLADKARFNNPETRDEYIRELWDSNADYVLPYKKAWQKEVELAEQQALDNSYLISDINSAINIGQDPRLNGEWYKYNRNYSPQYYRNAYRLAKGGSVRARFIDYLNHINKELQEATKNQLKRNELATKKLTHDLDRLSREQMILLRSIFK